jgi:hypothetical protein
MKSHIRKRNRSIFPRRKNGSLYILFSRIQKNFVIITLSRFHIPVYEVRVGNSCNITKDFFPTRGLSAKNSFAEWGFWWFSKIIKLFSGDSERLKIFAFLKLKTKDFISFTIMTQNLVNKILRQKNYFTMFSDIRRDEVYMLQQGRFFLTEQVLWIQYCVERGFSALSNLKFGLAFALSALRKKRPVINY